jgi:hypothetical protein
MSPTGAAMRVTVRRPTGTPSRLPMNRGDPSDLAAGGAVDQPSRAHLIRTLGLAHDKPPERNLLYSK